MTFPDSTEPPKSVLPPDLIKNWNVLFGETAFPPLTPDDLVERLPSVIDTPLAPMSGYVRFEIRKHLDYLLRHENFVNRDHRPEEYQKILKDFVSNIDQNLRQARIDWERQKNSEDITLPDDILDLIVAAEQELEGWCDRAKSLAIAQFVLSERPLFCVELGVFAGRSLIPCAAALRHIGRGYIVGVDAWSNQTALTTKTDPENDRWWASVEIIDKKRQFFRFLVKHDLLAQVGVVEAPSNRAVSLFNEIDYLHIDGSHSTIASAEDVILYLPKVRPGGLVLFDDANWESTRPAQHLLAEFAEHIADIRPSARAADFSAMYRRKGP